MNDTSQKPLYECTRCGNCCRWRGYVHLTMEETARIAEFLGITHDEFMDKYTRDTRYKTGISLIERDDASCIFLEGNTCMIHDVKPKQCRNFPNDWNFEGFREVCNAREIPRES